MENITLMKIAIYGGYKAGNYGDDLYAITFANYLKKLGADPWVNELDKTIANRYLINTTDSLDELFQNAKFAILGGGHALSSRMQPDDTGMIDLARLASDHRCPIFPVCIGGDGLIGVTLPQNLSNFFQDDICQSSTVRLLEDLILLNQLGKEAVYYPDVLLVAAKYWNIYPTSQSSEKIHVGINIPNSLSSRWLAKQLKVIASVKKNIVFHFIRMHLETSPINLDFLPELDSPYIKHHIYSDPVSSLEFVASLDLIISYKLHMGLTALSLKVPFYCVGGSPKVHAFLKSINANFAIWPAMATKLQLAAFLANAENIKNAKVKFDWSIIERYKKLSWGHMNFLNSLVNNELGSPIEVNKRTILGRE